MIGTTLVLTILEKSFEKWVEKEGTEAIARAAKSISAWSLESILHLGPTKAAQHKASKRLKSESALLTVKLQQQEESYETLPGRLYDWDGIVKGQYKSLALIPRAVVNRQALVEVKAELGEAALLAEVDKNYFFDSLISEFDKSFFEDNKPSLSKPLISWKKPYSYTYNVIAKGVDSRWKGKDPLQTKYPGYFIVTNSVLTSKEQRAALEDSFEKWQGEIAGWSQQQWDEASGF